MDATAPSSGLHETDGASSSLPAVTFSGLTVVAVDADDTLWPTRHLYTDAIMRFAALLAPWHPGDDLPAKLSAHHSANASRYGFGALALGQSMMEFAAKVLPEDAAAGSVLAGIAEAVAIIHQDPAQPYPWTADALQGLSERGLRVVMITKGVHSEQMAKLKRSDLSKLLTGGAVVLANKDSASYRGIMTSLGARPDQFLMCGDSLDSDVSPVLACGAKAVLIAGDTSTAAVQPPEGVPVVPRLIDLLELLPETEPHGAQPSGGCSAPQFRRRRTRAVP